MLKHVTPSVASELLRRHGLRAGVRHGQHFLVDPNTVDKIVRLAKVSSSDVVLEIGPGIGSLTVALAAAGPRVVAVEVDEAVANVLEEVLAERSASVELYRADALVADLAEFAGGACKLVSNLPYNVATPLFMRVLTDFEGIGEGLVMVQREVGERWTARPGTKAYGSVSVKVDFIAEAEIVAEVPRTVFMPPPKVSSVLVAFRRRAQPKVEVSDRARFFAFLQDAFAHRRKTLSNSLSSSGYDRSQVVDALASRGIDPRARPEDVDIDSYAHLFGTVARD